MRSDGPIFIGGLDASGKTPLRAMLDHLDNVTFIRRAYLWTELYGRYGDLDDEAGWQACLAALAAHPGLGLSTKELSTAASRVGRGQRTYPRLFGAVMEQIAARSRAPRWGVQEALVEVRADELLAAYPGARMIHLIRDPRDRHAIAVRGKGASGWRVGVSVARWRTSAQLAKRNRELHRDAYRVVRYEDLVSAPVETVQQVCHFVGETPTAAMLEAARAWAEDPKSSAGLGSRLRPAELRFIEGRLAGPMRHFGYSPIASRPTLSAVLEEGGTAALASLAAWRWGDRDLRPETRPASARKLPA